MKLKKFPSLCPVCSGTVAVAELQCPCCATSMRGQFELPPLLRLPSDLQEFAQVFLLCRGNIREVEKELGVSYPTVRNRLEAVIEHLGRGGHSRNTIMEALERGELSPEEAIKRLEEIDES